LSYFNTGDYEYSPMQARTCAALILSTLFNEKKNLSVVMPVYLARLGDKRDRALAQELSYGVMRWYFKLDVLLAHMLERPVKHKDNDIKALLLIGLYQFQHTRIPVHAVVSGTVDACQELRKPWAKGLVNAILRRYQNESEHILEKIDGEPTVRFSHPSWFLELLQKDYPRQWQAIVEANNQKAPMYLRINPLKTTLDTYLRALDEAGIHATPTGTDSPQAIKLERPVDVDRLPFFSEGHVSVQDLAAQFAPKIMDLIAGQRVLDACAAPGGKLAHLQESEPGLAELVAIESEPHRFERLQETVDRLGLKVILKLADARDVGAWWDSIPFDRILLDAPCSATGVVRRHPDIKYLRQPDDIVAICRLQRELLAALWPLLRSGGKLLYVTCSILSRENDQQIAGFLENHGNASVIDIKANWGHNTGYGRQILPGESDMDGFYYACLQKI